MSQRSKNSDQIRLFTLELLALECQKKAIFDLVRSLSPSVLTGFSSNLQVTRTDIKFGTSLNLGQIGIFTLELLALECHKSPYLTLSDQ